MNGISALRRSAVATSRATRVSVWSKAGAFGSTSAGINGPPTPPSACGGVSFAGSRPIRATIAASREAVRAAERSMAARAFIWPLSMRSSEPSRSARRVAGSGLSVAAGELDDAAGASPVSAPKVSPGSSTGCGLAARGSAPGPGGEHRRAPSRRLLRLGAAAREPGLRRAHRPRTPAPAGPGARTGCAASDSAASAATIAPRFSSRACRDASSLSLPANDLRSSACWPATASSRGARFGEAVLVGRLHCRLPRDDRPHQVVVKGEIDGRGGGPDEQERAASAASAHKPAGRSMTVRIASPRDSDTK